MDLLLHWIYYYTVVYYYTGFHILVMVLNNGFRVKTGRCETGKLRSITMRENVLSHLHVPMYPCQTQLCSKL